MKVILAIFHLSSTKSQFYSASFGFSAKELHLTLLQIPLTLSMVLLEFFVLSIFSQLSEV